MPSLRQHLGQGLRPSPASCSPQLAELGGGLEVLAALGRVDERLRGVAAAQPDRVVDGVSGTGEGNDVRTIHGSGPERGPASDAAQAPPWYDSGAMTFRSLALVPLLLLACGDSSGSDSASSTTVAPHSLGLGEACLTDDDQCKEEMVCVGELSSCNSGVCLSLCLDDDDCPLIDGNQSFCRPKSTAETQRVCVWFCDGAACPASLGQTLECRGGACSPPQCEGESG